MAVIVGEEYRPPFWGTRFLFGMRDHLISPFTTGYEGTAIESLYPSNTDMFRKAKAQGATVAYVHAFGGEGDPLEGWLGGAKEFPVDVALGTVDAVEWSSSTRATLRVWHHALNNDFPVAAVGGEDANTSLHRHTMLGSVRTYAFLGPALDARGWIEAVGAGRSFVSTGPLVEFRVNQHMPGESIHLPAGGGVIEVEAKAWSTLPLTKALIYRNGSVWKTIPLSGDRTGAEFRERATVSESGWYSFTVEGEPVAGSFDSSYPQAVSNAVRVYVGDQKIRNRASAEYFIAWIDKLRKMAEAAPGWRSQAEKDKVFPQMEKAKQVYAERAREAAR